MTKDQLRKTFLDWELVAHWIGRVFMGVLSIIGYGLYEEVREMNAKIDGITIYIAGHERDFKGVVKDQDKLEARVDNLESGKHPATANRFTEQRAMELHQKTKEWVEYYFIRKR